MPFIAQETTHDVCGTLQARSYKGPNHENARDGQLVIQHQYNEEPVIAFDGYNQSITENVYRALRIGIDSEDCIMEPTMQVRRLTPIECERLMGWPDNHTSIGTNGPVSDTNRYKMCGNGVASPVAQWIGQHLMRITEGRPDTE